MLLRNLRRSCALLKTPASSTACHCGQRSRHAWDVKPDFLPQDLSQKQISARLSAKLHELKPSEISKFLEDYQKTISSSHIIIAMQQLVGPYRYLSRDMRKGHVDEIQRVLERHTDKLSSPTAATILQMLWREGVEDFFSAYPATTKKLIAQSLNVYVGTDTEGTKRLLSFMSEYLKGTGDQELVHPVLQELEHHAKQLTIKEASDLLRLLGLISGSEQSFARVFPQWKVVFQKVQEGLLPKTRNLSAKQLKYILAMIIQGNHAVRSRIHSKINLYNQDLVNAVIDKVISDNMGFEVSVSVTAVMRTLRHKNIELLDYCTTAYFHETRQNEGLIENETKKFVALISGLSLAGYRTNHWEDIKKRISESNEILDLDINTLIVLVDDLVCLDWYPTHLLEKIFKYPFHYPKIITRKLVNIYQILKSDPDYTGPMPSDAQVADLKAWLSKLSTVRKRSIFYYLKEGTRDKSCFRTNVTTRLLHAIDHVVALRREDGKPVPIASHSLVDNRDLDRFEYLEDIKVPEGCQLIPIVTMTPTCYFTNTNELLRMYQKSIESLQSLGYRVAVVNLAELEEVSKGPRIQIVMDKVRMQLEPFNHKSIPPTIATTATTSTTISDDDRDSEKKIERSS